MHIEYHFYFQILALVEILWFAIAKIGQVVRGLRRTCANKTFQLTIPRLKFQHQQTKRSVTAHVIWRLAEVYQFSTGQLTISAVQIVLGNSKKWASLVKRRRCLKTGRNLCATTSRKFINPGAGLERPDCLHIFHVFLPVLNHVRVGSRSIIS